MIDLLYVSFNRLEYTKATFQAMVDNTNWGQVERLFVADDSSTDGTYEYLDKAILAVPVPVDFVHEKLGGPVAAMNWYLDNASDDIEMFAKLDNDMVVCPGWLDEMLKQMTLNPGLDVLGMEPFVGDPQMPPFPDRTVGEHVAHVGGKGLIRRRVFSHCRPVPGGRNGYQGWTQHQEKHPQITKAWITPDLPVFGLDQMRPEDGPWRALAEDYEELGWQRMWPSYGSDEHYRWWLDEQEANAA